METLNLQKSIYVHIKVDQEVSWKHFFRMNMSPDRIYGGHVTTSLYSENGTFCVNGGGERFFFCKPKKENNITIIFDRKQEKEAGDFM